MTSMSPEFQNLLRDLLGIASEATKQEQILTALAFSDMHGRFEDVEPAHFETFKWIFDEAYDDHVDDDARPVGKLNDKVRFRDIEHDYLIREPFLHWLSAGKGIFHISGKLGSGKSTLMKFLCDHRRTTAELQKWAGTYSVLD